MSNRMEMRRAAIGVECLTSRQPAYLDLIGPDEDEATRVGMLTMSSCALTVRGLWRRIGIVHSRLDAPYVNQMAVVDVLTIAKEAGAWHPLRTGEEWAPQRGDVIHVYAPEHVATLVEVEVDPRGGWLCESIDGGQGMHGANIARVKRRIIGTTDTRLDFGTVRQVTGWINCDQVGDMFGTVGAADTDRAPA